MKKFAKTELKEVLSYDTQEYYIAMPNNIFKMLSSNEEIMKHKAPHAAVIYSYVYLNTWLYRYAKYGKISEELTTTEGIKTILGLSPKCREYNYAFKKNGVLEQLGLLKTRPYYEAPIDWVICGGEPEFVLLDDVDVVDFNVRRKQIKYPVFALENRVVNGQECEGTFFDPRYTHVVPFEVFIECMTNPKLGCTAFYIYAYLQNLCQINGGEIEVSIERMIASTGIRHTTLLAALDALKNYGLVRVKPSAYIINRAENEKTHANIYSTVTDYCEFAITPMGYEKAGVQYASDALNDDTKADEKADENNLFLKNAKKLLERNDPTQINEEQVAFAQQEEIVLTPVQTVTSPSLEEQVSDKYDSLMDIENLIQHELGA